jgi:hypothetical protein
MNATVQPHAPEETDFPRRLPIDVRPNPTDTVDSYITRLAHANHLDPGHLRSYCCAPPDYRGRPRPERIAAVSGRSLPVLQRVLTDLRCARCGRPQPAPAVSGRPARWCSTTCRKTAHRKRHPSAPKAAVELVCHRCGTMFAKSRAVLWCSRRCRESARREVLGTAIESTCEHCGRHVTSTRPIRWCTSSCREAAWNRPGKCGLCAQPLTTAPVGRPAKWCSARCRRAAYRERRRPPATRI